MDDAISEFFRSIDKTKDEGKEISNLKLSRALCGEMNLRVFGRLDAPPVGSTGKIHEIPFEVVDFGEPDWSYEVSNERHIERI